MRGGRAAPIAILAALIVVLAPLATPVTASPIVYAITGGAERIPWAALEMSSSGNVLGFCATYAMELASGPHAYVLPVTTTAIAAAAGLVALYQLSRNPDRSVEAGILGRQEAVTSLSEVKRRNETWDGRSDPVPGVVVGFAGKYAVVADCVHAVVVSPSGGGKTRGSVYPTVDLLTFKGEANVIVTDPSMEIFITARPCLERRGYDVTLIDLEEPRRGARYNPLALVTKLFREGDAAAAEARARETGAVLFPAQGNENDIFANAAGGVFAAVCYVVATDPSVEDGERHIWSCVETILEGTRRGTAAFKDWINSFGADSPVVSMAATFLASEGKLESSILASLHDGLQPFTSYNMRWLTSADELDIDRMVEGRSAVFVHTMGPNSPSNRIASLFLSQHWAEVQRLGKRRELRDCWVVGDEFHSLPKFDMVNAIENSRKYGLHYLMYLQSVSGLDPYRTYKEDGKDAILANCDVKVLYKAGSDQDARYFEALSGFRTVRTMSTSSSRNAQGSSSGTGYSEQKVPVWPMGDLLEHDPRDGALVVRSASNGKPAGKFQVPVRDVSETFCKGHFGTVGTREYEREVIGAELDRLEAVAKSKPLEVGAWTPDFEAAKTEETRAAEVESDEFAMWDD